MEEKVYYTFCPLPGKNEPGLDKSPGQVIFTKQEIFYYFDEIEEESEHFVRVIPMDKVYKCILKTKTDDCKVTIHHQYKCDQLLFTDDIISILDMKEWDDYNYCKMAVQQDGLAIRLVNNPTPELWKLAVQENGMAIQYLNPIDLDDDDVKEIYKLAVQQNSYASKLIEK